MAPPCSAGCSQGGSQFGADVMDQTMNLTALHLEAGEGGQIFTGGLESFPSRGPGGQAHQRGRKAPHQSQGFIQRKTPVAGLRAVKVRTAEFDQAEDRMHRNLAVGVAFLAGTTGVFRDRKPALSIQFFQQLPSVFEQSLPQAQFDGFAVANAVLAQVLARQSQEGFGFLELLPGELWRLEFFFRSGLWHSSRVT